MNTIEQMAAMVEEKVRAAFAAGHAAGKAEVLDKLQNGINAVRTSGVAAPVRRGPGRPRGSVNKPKAAKAKRRKAGRPPGTTKAVMEARRAAEAQANAPAPILAAPTLADILATVVPLPVANGVNGVAHE